MVAGAADGVEVDGALAGVEVLDESDFVDDSDVDVDSEDFEGFALLPAFSLELAVDRLSLR